MLWLGESVGVAVPMSKQELQDELTEMIHDFHALAEHLDESEEQLRTLSTEVWEVRTSLDRLIKRSWWMAALIVFLLIVT